jgi:hypothetical protein
MSDENVQVDLDLDELQPKPRSVKISGQIIEVNSPKFNDLISLMAVFSKLQNVKSNEEGLAMVAELNGIFEKVAPDIGAKGIELTIDQFNKLIQFIFTMASPTEQKQIEEAGITLDAEKKSPEEPSSDS